MLELVLRLVFSLAVVLGLLLLLARLSARKLRGGSDALVRVVQRQPLSRTSAVTVVTIGPRVLVLGTTEQSVQVLAELDPDELELEIPAAPDDVAAGPAPPRALTAVAPGRRTDGRLAGSLLAAQTWRQALAAARGDRAS